MYNKPMKAKSLKCATELFSSPLRAMATIGDALNGLFGFFYFFAVGGTGASNLYRQMSEVGNVKIWSGLIFFGAIASQIAFAFKKDQWVAWAQFAEAAGWLYALVLYMQFGNIYPALPYVIRPVFTSAYIYIKLSLDIYTKKSLDKLSKRG